MSTIPVLYVSHVPDLSGAEESLLALLAAIDRSRFAPYLACPPGELARRAEQINVETIPLDIKGFKRTRNPLKLSAYAMAWRAGTGQLRKIVDDLAPRVIHANSAQAQFYAGSVAQKAERPCVWHARDLRPLPFPVRGVCQNADHVIAISQAVADSLIAGGFSKTRLSCIHNGIDPDEWRGRVTGSDIRMELGLSGDDRVLLMAAQFVPWKRHEDAVRALPHLLKRQTAARLVIAGSDRFAHHPDYADSLRNLAAELDVSEQVVFAGHRDDMPDVMSAADIVIIPSDAEPFGRVAIEAMALGKPVVGTRAGGLPEVVRDGETGLLVVPRFPESLADACLRLLENESLSRSLGEAGRARVERHFHIADVARETQTLYDKLLHPPLKWIRT